jgi:hypothetical protein
MSIPLKYLPIPLFSFQTRKQGFFRVICADKSRERLVDNAPENAPGKN